MSYQALTDSDLAALLPPIPPDAHKYTRGSLLVLAGSARFPGAAVLAARAAARAGAGYVTLAIPEPAAAVAQAHLLSIPVIAAPSDDGSFTADAWESIRALITHLNAIVLGPGLTTTPASSAFVQAVLHEVPMLHKGRGRSPVLLDADALNILSLLLQQGLNPVIPETALILTPHEGELKRLCKATGVSDVRQLAEALDAVVVAKGPTTRVVSPLREHVSASGTPALAKAGTGDVLSGIIGSLAAQGAAPFDAAMLGVELHSRTGWHAEKSLGRRAVCAEDVIDSLPSVLQTLE
jgi:NAD(P)H-hydrate epimerase